MRIAIAAAVTCLSIIGMTATAQVHAAIRKHTEIPPESLDLALRELAKDRGFQLVYLTENVAALQTRGAIGDFTVDEALKKLLSDSRLEYKFVDENTVSIFPRTRQTSALGGDRSRSAGNDVDPGSAPKRSSGEQFRIAQVAPGASAGSSSVTTTTGDTLDSAAARGLSEIVVTAQKKTERLQDVPVPVTVVNTQELLQNNQLKLEDYYTTVPGLTLTPASFGDSQVMIRGIASSVSAFTNPTVSVLVDDVPYGSSTALGGGTVIPEFDPGDLARVEVLRGPQGTLYGARSLGGIIKYVTIDPSTEGVSGHVETGLSDVHNGHQLGYEFRGSVNLPVTETLALRASGFYQESPGYIDNIVNGARGVNKDDVYGGRLTGLWQIDPALSLKLGAFVQIAHSDGYNVTSKGLPDLQQAVVPGVGAEDLKYQLYTATLRAKLGGADLTSITAYGINQRHSSTDATSTDAAETYTFFGVMGTPVTNIPKTERVTEEVRLDIPIGQHFDWLVGGFYTHERSPYLQQYLAANETTGQIVGVGINYNWLGTYQEYAAFTDLTVHFTDRFDVQFGGRESVGRQSYAEVDTGPYVPDYDGATSPYNYGGTLYSKYNAFTYLVTPRFKFSDDLMAYVRVASGYRPGGPNGGVPTYYDVPKEYGPDKTTNYEIGVKGDVLNNALSFDASIYYIDWTNIQLNVRAPLTVYATNASDAKSEGVELSLKTKPLAGISLSAWVAWNEAVVTTAFPPTSTVHADPGARLPYSPKISGNFSIDDEFALTSSAKGFVGGGVSYVGDRLGNFRKASAPRGYLSPYARLDLHGGVRYNSWTISAFANNVADRRGRLSADADPFLYIIPPRTVGLKVLRAF